METAERWRHRRHLSGFQALELNVFLHELAMGITTTFGAVFMYSLGESPMSGLWYMVAFYGGQRMLTMLFIPLIGRWLPRIGYRRMMFRSMLAEIGKLLCYTAVLVSGNRWWLVPAAVLGGLYLSGMSMSFQALFVTDNDNERLGEQVGVVLLFQYGGLVLAPLLGGILAQWEGFGLLFGATIGLLLLSMIPLHMMPKHSHKHDGFNINSMVDLMRREKTFAGSVSLWQLTVAVNDFFWPVYVVVLGHSYAFLGSLKSAIVLASGLSVWWLGRTYDRRPLHRIFLWGSVLEAFVWVGRFVATSAFGLAVTNVSERILSPLWWMKIRRYELSIGEEQPSMVYAMAHEVLVSVGLIGGLLLGGWVLLLSNFDWVMLGVVSALAILGSGWLMRGR